MDCSLPGSYMSHFTMIYGSPQQELCDSIKQTYIHTYPHTFTCRRLPLHEQVKLINSHYLHFLLHLYSLLIDIFAFLALFSCSVDLCSAVTHHPVSLDCRTIVSFQSGSLLHMILHQTAANSFRQVLFCMAIIPHTNKQDTNNEKEYRCFQNVSITWCFDSKKSVKMIVYTTKPDPGLGCDCLTESR